MTISKSGKPPASPITISKSRERLASPRDHQQVAETTGFPDNHQQVAETEESRFFWMRIQKNLDSVVTQHAGQILHPSPRLSFHCFSATLDRLAQPMPYGSAFVGGRSDGLSKTVNP